MKVFWIARDSAGTKSFSACQQRMLLGEDGFWREPGNEKLICELEFDEGMAKFLESFFPNLKPGQQIAVKIVPAFPRRKHDRKLAARP